MLMPSGPSVLFSQNYSGYATLDGVECFMHELFSFVYFSMKNMCELDSKVGNNSKFLL